MARRPSPRRRSPPSEKSSRSRPMSGTSISGTTPPLPPSSPSCARSSGSDPRTARRAPLASNPHIRGGAMAAKASRAAFGEALIELGATDERIVTLDADLSKSTMTAGFAKKFPDRAFNLGIAESNMVGIAAGLALTGRVPFACSFACFIVGRFETIRISVAYTNANVKIVGTHVGVAIGEDGYSQMGLEDIACIRALPNMPIVQPADELETRQAVAYAVEHPGPLYLRLTRQNLEPVSPPDYRFRLGRWCLLRPGMDVTLIATGGTVFNALQAARHLEREAISAE